MNYPELRWSQNWSTRQQNLVAQGTVGHHQTVHLDSVTWISLEQHRWGPQYWKSADFCQSPTEAPTKLKIAMY